MYLPDRQNRYFFSYQLCKYTVDKCRRLIGAILFGKLHRLVDGNADRHILIILHFIDRQANQREIYLSHASGLPAFCHSIDRLVNLCKMRHDILAFAGNIRAVLCIPRLLRLLIDGNLLRQFLPVMELHAKQQLKYLFSQLSSGHKPFLSLMFRLLRHISLYRKKGCRRDILYLIHRDSMRYLLLPMSTLAIRIFTIDTSRPVIFSIAFLTLSCTLADTSGIE